jgi:hypothetical protein
MARTTRKPIVICDGCGFTSPDLALFACPRCGAVLGETSLPAAGIAADRDSDRSLAGWAAIIERSGRS